MRALAVLPLLALAAAPVPAAAADSLVATVERATTVEAAGGRAVWSTWDPAVGVYRLTGFAGSTTRALPVEPNPVPFDVDLSPNGRLAVYSRCERPPVTTWMLNGRRGCDVHRFDFSTGRESRVARVSSAADEFWPAITGSGIAFTRTYPGKRRLLYWHSLTGRRPSRRLAGGTGGVPEELDLRGGRIAFVRTFEYGGAVRLATLDGRGRRLVRIPGSGAAARQLGADGPTVARGLISWALSSDPGPSELRRHDLASGRNTRATALVDGVTHGFAQHGSRSWYVRAAGGRYEVRVATRLIYEPAPPIVLD